MKQQKRQDETQCLLPGKCRGENCGNERRNRQFDKFYGGMNGAESFSGAVQDNPQAFRKRADGNQQRAEYGGLFDLFCHRIVLHDKDDQNQHGENCHYDSSNINTHECSERVAEHAETAGSAVLDNAIRGYEYCFCPRKHSRYYSAAIKFCKGFRQGGVQKVDF